MKNHRMILLMPVTLLLLLAFSSCQKDPTTSSDTLYVPSSSDVTESATLEELQQGRALYISNCGSCHGLYLPESFTPTKWKNNILPSMTPRTSLNSAQIQLVSKYVSKGR